jgi:hypothetical protein
MGNQVTELVLTAKQTNKIKRALKALEEVREEMDMQSDVKGGVNWYIEDCGNLHLMDGCTHCDNGDPNHGLIVGDVFNFNQSSGGAW